MRPLQGAESQPFPLRVVTIRGRPSDPMLLACSSLGIALRRACSSHATPRNDVRRVMDCARHARVVLIGGPSGSGKSTLVRAMIREARRLGHQACVAREPRRPRNRPVLDLLTGTVSRRLGLLARAGLSEAALLPRTTRELSTGQRYRLALAMTLDQAGGRGSAWVFADEFASTLDRTTARILAASMGKWARSRERPWTLVAATSHEDLVGPLSPDVLVWCSLDGGIDIVPRTPRRVREKQP